MTKFRKFVREAKSALRSHDIYRATECIYYARKINEAYGSDYSDVRDMLQVEKELIYIWINDYKMSDLLRALKERERKNDNPRTKGTAFCS